MARHILESPFTIPRRGGLSSR